MCLLIYLEEIWSTSDLRFVQVISVEKRELREHFSASACSFLGLGLRPRPQKCGLGFKKLSLSSLFSTSVTWKNLKSDEDKFFLRLGKHKNQTKYYFLTLHENICRLLWKSVNKRIWTIHSPTEISKTIWKISSFIFLLHSYS